MRLLTLNGGGTAGYATCLLLQKLEHETRRPCYELFDMIHGVSTGAIIAGALGIGMSADDLVDLYRRDIPLIFKKLHWPFWRWYVGPTKYNAEVLEEILEQIFGNQVIGDTRTACMIHATQMSPRLQPYFWKSWRWDSMSVKLSDIIRASSAAPTYFTPKQIGLQTFVDGGMCANNPTHCTIVEALRLGVRLSDISAVNIQLGDAPSYAQDEVAKLKSIVRWAPKLTEVLLSSNVEIGEYLATHLIQQYINVDFNLSEPLDFWSDEFQSKCATLVDQYWSVNRNRIVAQVLMSKKSSAAALAETIKVPCIQNDTLVQGSNGNHPLDPRANH